MELVLKPVLLGIIFRATGNAPPGMVPVKGAVLAGDCMKRSQEQCTTLDLLRTLHCTKAVGVR